MLDRTAGTEHPHHANLPPSPWTDAKIARLKEMRAANEAYSVISKELGFTRSAIAGKVLRLGMDKLPRNPVKPRVRRAHDGGAVQQRLRNKHLQKVKTVKVRSPSNGGAVMVESVMREEPPVRADFLSIALMDLEPKHCRFPKGEGTSILFCGQKTISGESWCRDCYRIVYQPPRPYLPTGGSKPAVV